MAAVKMIAIAIAMRPIQTMKEGDLCDFKEVDRIDSNGDQVSLLLPFSHFHQQLPCCLDAGFDATSVQECLLFPIWRLPVEKKFSLSFF